MLTFFLSLFALFPLFGEILTSPSIDTLIQRADGSFWLVVDLDNTVFEGKEALGHSHWFDDHFAQEMANGSTKADATAKLYLTWVESQKVNNVQPVEARFVEWIGELQEKGVPVIALTARQSVLAPSTDRQLASIGIDFSKTAPKGEFKTLFPHSVLYAKGIIYSHDFNDKGAIFTTFLADNHLKPQKILFVDDKKHNVESFEKAALARGIDILSLHYTALDHREPIYNRTLAEFQHQKLNSILSNDEALLLLHHQPDIHQ